LGAANFGAANFSTANLCTTELCTNMRRSLSFAAQRSCQKPADRCVELIARFLAEPMTAALNNLVPACPHAIDGARTRCKYPAVEDGIAAASGERGMRGVKGHDVGPRARRHAGGGLRQSPHPPDERGIEHGAASREASPAGQHIALAVLEALAIFELTQFVGDTDQDVGVSTDAEPAPGVTKLTGCKNAVA
jgi:hypothetical protein